MTKFKVKDLWRVIREYPHEWSVKDDWLVHESGIKIQQTPGGYAYISVKGVKCRVGGWKIARAIRDWMCAQVLLPPRESKVVST